MVQLSLGRRTRGNGDVFASLTSLEKRRMKRKRKKKEPMKIQTGLSIWSIDVSPKRTLLNSYFENELKEAFRRWSRGCVGIFSLKLLYLRPIIQKYNRSLEILFYTACKKQKTHNESMGKKYACESEDFSLSDCLSLLILFLFELLFF